MFDQLFAEFGASDWIALGSAVLAFISSVVAFLYGLAARRSERRLRSLETQVSRIDRELIVWGIRCMDAMSSGHILLATAGSGRAPDLVRIRRDEIQAELSALVDMGRLYFPNRSPDLEGTDRNAAFRGFRPAILDALMLVHEELRRLREFNLDHTKEAATNVFGARRIFISEFQEEIDRFRDKELLAQVRIADDDWTDVTKLVDNFEARHGSSSFWVKRPRSRNQLLAELKGVGRARA